MNENTDFPTETESNTESCINTSKEVILPDTSHSSEWNQSFMPAGEMDGQKEMDTKSIIIDHIRIDTYFGPEEDMEDSIVENSIVLPADTPFSEIVCATSKDARFNEMAKIQINYFSSNRPTDGRPNVTVMKTLSSCKIGELGNPQKISHTYLENENTEKYKAKPDEKMDIISLGSVKMNVDNDSKEEEQMEYEKRKEDRKRKVRCKQRKKQGMPFLWNEYLIDGNRCSVIRGAEWLRDTGIEAQMFADFLNMSLADFRRLVNKIEKVRGNNYYHKRRESAPIINSSRTILSEKEMKNVLGWPKTFITVEGVFEIMMYLGSVS